MKSFPTLTATDVRSLVTRAEWQIANEAFLLGDHLQGGTGWIGPGPGPKDAGYSVLITDLCRSMISKNVIKSVVGRKVNAALGRAPRWGTVPVRLTDGDEAIIEGEDTAAATALQTVIDSESVLIAKYDGLLTAWWDEKGVHETLQEFATRCESEGRATLRIFIPPIHTHTESGTIAKAPIADSLKRIFVEAPANDLARTVLDRESMASVGVYIFTEDVEGVDKNGAKTTTPTQRAELTYLDETGKTVLRIVGSETTDEARQGDVLDLAGNLWHFELEGEPLITDSVRRLQKLVNLANSVASRNLKDAGWREEYRINALVAADYARKVPGDETSQLEATPVTIQRGPGSTQTITSDTYQNGSDANGHPTYAPLPASVYHTEPVSPQAAIDTAQHAENAIRDECHQGHLNPSGSDANSSGEMLKQKRADFEMNLGKSIAGYNRIGRALLETVLRIALAYSDETEKPFDVLRVNFECRADIGPATALEVETGLKLVAAGAQSLETFQSTTLDIDDTDAENARIARENETNTAATLKQYEADAAKWQAATAAQLAGVSAREALRQAGLDDAKQAEMASEQEADLMKDTSVLPGGKAKGVVVTNG